MNMYVKVPLTLNQQQEGNSGVSRKWLALTGQPIILLIYIFKK